MSKIQDAIEIMTRIIDGGIDNLHAKDKEKETIHHNEDEKSNDSCHEAHEEQQQQQNEIEKELKKQKQVEENFKLHDALDCRLLLEEFRKLFAQKPTADYEDNATAIIDKLFQAKGAAAAKNAGGIKYASGAKKSFYGNLKPGKNSNSAEIFRVVRNNKGNDNGNNNNNNNNCDASMNNKCSSSGEANKLDEMVFTNYIKSRLESKDPSEISIKQYSKYKSLLLAFEETKKCLNNADSSVASGNTGHKTKSTGYTLSHKQSNFNNNYQNLNNNNNNHYQSQQFQFRSDFYNNTARDWNKPNLLGSGKKQFANSKLSNNNNAKSGNFGNIGSSNNSPEKFGKTGFNYKSSNNRINAMSKKIKLPDPQYNFNYQAKYFGVDVNLDKNNHKYGNFLLPLLNKKDKEKGHNDNNDFVPKTLMMELKNRNEL